MDTKKNTHEQLHEIYITDKTGKIFFRTIAGPLATFSELRNFKRRLKAAKQHPKQYKFLDIDTAYIVLDGIFYSK